MVLADTGALYALVDASDGWHTRMTDWWAKNAQPVAVPITVLPELSYLLNRRIGAHAGAAMIHSIADGEFVVEDVTAEDWSPIATLMERYSDLALGFVDASIVVIAERLDARYILTTNRRHFGVVRSARGRALQLEP